MEEHSDSTIFYYYSIPATEFTKWTDPTRVNRLTKSTKWMNPTRFKYLIKSTKWTDPTRDQYSALKVDEPHKRLTV